MGRSRGLLDRYAPRLHTFRDSRTSIFLVSPLPCLAKEATWGTRFNTFCSLFCFYTAGGGGGFRPSSFITICKSFQASFFWRGSRRRNAGWYVTASLVPRKSYHLPRSSIMEELRASRVL